MTESDLLNKIDAAFPVVEMPAKDQLVFEKYKGGECDEIAEDLEQPLASDEVVKIVCRNLSCLSAKGWVWVLPFYLKYCLSEKAMTNRTETEFLIYNLSPAPEFVSDTNQRLRELNNQQIRVLIYFLEWCLSNEYWKEFYRCEIEGALTYLNNRWWETRSASN